MTNRSQKSGQRTAICHLSLVICQISLICGREKKCSAGFQPANGPVDAKGVIQAHMPARRRHVRDRKSTRLNSRHAKSPYAAFSLKKKRENSLTRQTRKTT